MKLPSRSAVATASLLAMLLGAPLLADPGEVRSLGDHFTGQASNPDSDPVFFAALGSSTLFSAVDGEHGRELWITDGTSQGTRLLRDIFPGPRHGDPEGLVTFDGRVYFRATDSSFGEELWASDGTSEGTVLVADLWPGVNQSSNPLELTVVGNTLYFTAETGDEGRELWKIPVGGGPELVVDLRPGPDGSHPEDLLAMGGALAFSVTTAATGRELGISNGTAEGTEVIDVETGPTGSFPEPLHGQAAKVLFSAETSVAGRELYSYTSIGDQLCLVADAVTGPTGSFPREAIANGTDIYFTADQTSGPGKHFLRSIAGCVGVLHNLNNADSAGLTLHDGRVLFESEGDLWITDGVGPGTTADMIATPEIEVAYSYGSENVWFVPWDGLVWFAGEAGIWSTDGTAGNTQRRYFCTNCPAAVKWLQPGADALFAAIDDDFVGEEPYLFTTGPHFSLVADIHRDIGNSRPSEFTTLGSRVYFPAYTDDEGRELLAWDGGSGPAEVVEDLEPGDSDANPHRLRVAGTKLYYEARSPGLGYELRVLEDPLAGSSVVIELGNAEPFGSLGDQLFFVSRDENGVEQLWVTTGTGATQLTSFPDGPVNGVEDAAAPVAVGGQLFFGANDGTHGGEVWVTDGASAEMVVDLNTGPGTGDSRYYGRHDGLFYFAGDDGTQQALWSTDGSVQNTQFVAGHLALPVFSIGARLAYWGYEETMGYELWGTDGTPGNEILLTEANPGPAHGIYPFGVYHWAVTGGKAFFQANSVGNGVELWVSDGTPAGTQLLRDIAPGPQSSEPWYVTALPNGDVVFTAWSPDAGFELWRSNGTSSGTYRVTDLAPGAESSFPSESEVFGDWVVFSAWSGTAGREPWAYDWSGEPFLFGDGFETGDTTAWD